MHDLEHYFDIEASVSFFDFLFILGIYFFQGFEAELRFREESKSVKWAQWLRSEVSADYVVVIERIEWIRNLSVFQLRQLFLLG